MTLFKKTLMLTLILLLMIPPGSLDDIYKVSAEPNYEMATDDDFSGSRDGSFRYIGTHEYVEIPHMIKGVSVTSYSGMFQNYEGSELKGVKSTNKNVTNMNFMFLNASSLTELDLSSFDTSNVTAMSSMFWNAISLTELDLSSFDTSNVATMSSMFQDASNLTELDLSNFDTSNVTDMYGMFNGASSLTKLDLSNFDTSNVTDMNQMFSGASSLTKLDLSNFDTSKVTDMRSMFYIASSLTELDISSFDTSKVTNMQRMFYNATNLTELDLSSFNTSKVTNMNQMFSGAGRLEELDLSNFDTSNVTDMSSMFWNTISLTELDLSSFDTSNVTHMNSMFSGASELTELDLSKFDTSNVTYMNSMFSGAGNLTELDLSSFNTSKVTNMNQMFSNAGRLEELDLSNFDTSNVTDMSSMFWNAISLTELDLSSFDTSNVTTMNSMFSGAGNLTKLDLSNFDTSNVTNMAWMFRNTSNLTELDLSSFNTSKVTNMNQMFSGAGRLEELDLSNFDTSNVTDMSSMFEDASSLTELDLSKFDTSKVTNMSYMFWGASSLTELDLSSFDTSKVTDMNSMFRDASSLTKLDLSKFDTSNATDMSSIFSSASSLTELDLSSFDTSNVTNMSSMFNGASGLTELDLSSFDTSKVMYMNSMFLDASSLTEGYARTQEDANRFNDSSNKPEDLEFKVVPLIEFTADGNSTYKKEHKTQIDVSWSGGEQESLQYVWSTSKDAPSSGWAIFNNGDTLTRSTGTGDYYLHVKARSKQGIEETFTSEVFKLDNTNPTTPTIDAPTGWKNKNFTFSVTGGSDSHSGVSKREYRLNSGTWITYNSPVSISSNGTTKVEARTVDNAGNYSSIVSRDVKLDKISPTLNLNPNTTSWTNGDVKITAASSDSHSGIKRIRMSGDSSWTNGDTLTKSISKNGTYTFRVEDNAGNRTNEDIEVGNIDKVNPEITLSANITSTTHKDVVITAKASDKDSGVEEVIMPDNSIEKGGSNKTFTATKNGTYEFTVVDKAGNETKQSYTVNNIVRELSLGDIGLDKSSLSTNIGEDSASISVGVNDIDIIDWRDMTNNWKLTVEASELSNSSHSYGKGVISLGKVNISEGEVGKSGQVSSLSERAVIDDGPIMVVQGEGSRGEFSVNFGDNALGIDIDSFAAKVGKYSTELTWTLESTPIIQ